MCFSESGVELTLRQVLLPLWNAYSFFVTYANIYEWSPKEQFEEPVAELDRWILSVTGKLVEDVQEALDRYDLSCAANLFQPCVDRLTNWYIRRSRRRFWSDEESLDRQQAFETLYRVLKVMSKVIAPFMPFLAEQLWQNLHLASDEQSVHLSAFPEPFTRDLALEQAHEGAQLAVKLAHALRKGIKIKVRQPLSKVSVIASDPLIRERIASVGHIIKEEINVKEIEFSDDEHAFVTLKAKPNFRVLGKKVGKRMGAVQRAIEHLPYSKLNEFLEKKALSLHLEEGGRVELVEEDIEVTRIVRDGLAALHEGGITVVLDAALTEELLIEGFAREVINKLNTMRREMQLDVTDRIAVSIDVSEKARAWIESWLDYIQEETLARSVEFSANGGQQWDLNGERAVIEIQKV